MKSAKLHLIFIATIILFGALSLHAQEDYRYEAGGGVGITGYNGEANTSLPWRQPGVDIEAMFRYIANPRWGWKTAIQFGNLKGDLKREANQMPTDMSRAFNRNYCEIAETAEFNFFNFGQGETYRHLKKITPYITAGFGIMAWSDNGSMHMTPIIPVGMGLKYKLSERLNLGFSVLMKKTFSDHIDGVVDSFGIASSWIKNKDWCSSANLTISYEFSQRCAVCNYKDRL